MQGDAITTGPSTVSQRTPAKKSESKHRRYPLPPRSGLSQTFDYAAWPPRFAANSRNFSRNAVIWVPADRDPRCARDPRLGRNRDRLRSRYHNRFSQNGVQLTTVERTDSSILTGTGFRMKVVRRCPRYEPLRQMTMQNTTTDIRPRFADRLASAGCQLRPSLFESHLEV